MKKTKLTLLTLATALGFASAVHGQSLFTIDFDQDGPPNQIINSLSNITVSQVEISAGSISYGNFGSTFGGNDDFAESSGGWTETNFNDAKNFSFTITADSGFTFSLDSFSSLLRSTNAGPAAGTLLINGSDFATVDLENSDGQSFDNIATNLSNLTSATIEIAGWDNGSRTTTGGGAFRIGALEGIGSVAPVPEPSTYALIAGALVLGFVVVRRMKNA